MIDARRITCLKGKGRVNWAYSKGQYHWVREIERVVPVGGVKLTPRIPSWSVTETQLLDTKCLQSDGREGARRIHPSQVPFVSSASNSYSLFSFSSQYIHICRLWIGITSCPVAAAHQSVLRYVLTNRVSPNVFIWAISWTHARSHLEPDHFSLILAHELLKRVPWLLYSCHSD